MNETVDGNGFDGGHADLDSLLAYAHGERSGSEAEGLLEHSRACPECGDELAVMLALAGARVAVVADVTDTAGDLPGGSRRWVGLVAASVVLAALLGVVWISGWPRPDGPPAEGAMRLATAEAPDRLMLDFLFAPAATVANLEQARGGFVLIVDGRYEEAVAQLEPLHDARPDVGEVAAALGIALYLADDDGDRVEALLEQGRALRLQDFSNLAGWYLANHYLRRGDVVQAMGVLQDLSQWPDEPGAQARELLERLRTEIR